METKLSRHAVEQIVRGNLKSLVSRSIRLTMEGDKLRLEALDSDGLVIANWGLTYIPKLDGDSLRITGFEDTFTIRLSVN